MDDHAREVLDPNVGRDAHNKGVLNESPGHTQAPRRFIDHNNVRVVVHDLELKILHRLLVSLNAFLAVSRAEPTSVDAAAAIEALQRRST
jgi:hypothetical protein